MGAFWNPHGGIVFGSKKLTKKEVSLLKRKWSAKRKVTARPFIGWWKKFKRIILVLFQPH